MIRPISTEVVLFLIPFAVYALFLVATRKGLLDPAHWPLARLAWLVIAALVLMLGSFVYFATFGGAPADSTYIPAHVDENGTFVPGRTVPNPK
jgi:heme/copper-type cytochrome/quinol oxidase subunit 3